MNGLRTLLVRLRCLFNLRSHQSTQSGRPTWVDVIVIGYVVNVLRIRYVLGLLLLSMRWADAEVVNVCVND